MWYMMSLEVKSKTKDSVKCIVVDGGELKSQQHLNVKRKKCNFTIYHWLDLVKQVGGNRSIRADASSPLLVGMGQSILISTPSSCLASFVQTHQFYRNFGWG